MRNPNLGLLITFWCAHSGTSWASLKLTCSTPSSLAASYWPSFCCSFPEAACGQGLSGWVNLLRSPFMKDNLRPASVGFRLLELVCSSGVESFQPCHHGRICSILTKSGTRAETTQLSSRKPRFATRLAMDNCITIVVDHTQSKKLQDIIAHLNHLYDLYVYSIHKADLWTPVSLSATIDLHPKCNSFAACRT